MVVILDGLEYSAYSRYICDPYLKSILEMVLLKHISMESPMSLHSEILLRLAILLDFYNSQQKPDLSSEKIRLVQTASKFIMSDIRLVERENNCYPS